MRGRTAQQQLERRPGDGRRLEQATRSWDAEAAMELSPGAQYRRAAVLRSKRTFFFATSRARALIPLIIVMFQENGWTLDSELETIAFST